MDVGMSDAGRQIRQTVPNLTAIVTCYAQCRDMGAGMFDAGGYTRQTVPNP